MKPAPKVWSVVVKSGGCSGRTRKGFGKGYIPTHNLSNSHIHGDFLTNIVSVYGFLRSDRVFHSNPMFFPSESLR